ncbi:MAG: hypothetical protein HFJ28_00860 [Clostridia bacterium]|nr:hypothetical protein [Clostridia bacterium]
MNSNYKLVKYKKHPIREWFANIIDKMKSKFAYSKSWDKDTEDKIKMEFPNETEQKQAKTLLEELLSRNSNLLETLEIRMLHRELVDLFGKARFEKIITDRSIQEDILGLSKEQLQVYNYILNYNLIDFSERVGNLKVCSSCKDITLEGLQSLNEQDRQKAISIMLSDSAFLLNDLSMLSSYYERRKNICKQIIDNPQIVEQEYEKEVRKEGKFTYFPARLLYQMKGLSELDRIKYAIIEAKYGMSLEKAKILCSAFGDDIEEIEQSEETRIIKELKVILEEQDTEKLRQADLKEEATNYEGTINIIPNLRNAYLHKYQQTLYRVNEQDYIGTQSVRIGGKKTEVKIYNALGKENNRSEFNMLVTSLRRNLRYKS